ncbi:protein of unknown function [Xenorhabdus bovienii]|uniref:Uncharacterized protein n=1 Tax=Xenorhabdus bovienii TaxID=40576 RepID=A0A0B6X772_XENBV|nr:protein of unknown function [Xenorhabdus bovienii]
MLINCSCAGGKGAKSHCSDNLGISYNRYKTIKGNKVEGDGLDTPYYPHNNW